ncbi:DUF6507 family protein [Cellulomonas fimi]|uniref:Uncharacterized protein n=1 Tax=Cellulomonas fimi TaxID=1708 RepID=A0A7Y0M0Y1_CELFI|nr:DUF6507 family protein [Cellulomonas fimi]NMR21745.1 hypothetical protein [Cellulomonas fimi]
MSRWSITPEGVESVLTKVGTVAQTLSGAAEGLPASAESALAATGDNPIIGDALLGFFTHHRPTLESIGNRVNASVGGAAAATQWYLRGDETMAAQQQAAAATVAGTGVPTFQVPAR